MQTLTVYSESPDGYIISDDASSYAEARAGTGDYLMVDTTALYSRCGQAYQTGVYFCWESFFSFDTSSLPDNANIMSVTLSFYDESDDSVTDFTVEARLCDWGSELTVADWISGANLGSYTLLASKATSGWTIGQYNALTSESAFLSNINKTGKTRIVVCSSRMRNGDVPTGTEWIDLFNYRKGDGYWAKLVVEYGTPQEGAATLQSVASISPTANYSVVASAALQSVASITEATPSGIPSLDFTKYDFYVDNGTENKGFLEWRDASTRPSTQSAQLQPVRQDVGNNPYEARPESGDLFAQGDFSAGQGQMYFHHQGRNPAAYFWGEGFDISEVGKLTHLHDMGADYSSSSVKAMCQIKGVPFIAVGTKVRKSDGNFPGSWTEEDPQAAGTDTVEDICSCGDLGYVALNAGGIHKRDSAGTWSHLSDFAALKVAWVKDRLMAASSTVIAEINVGTGASTTLETFASGWTCEDIFEAGGFIYAVVRSDNEDVSRIHHYGLSSSGTLEKKGSTPFPQGQQMYSGAGYLNYAYIGGGKRNTSGGYDPILYQCMLDENGFLAYRKVAEEIGSGSSSYPVKAICPLGEAVLFGWSLTSSSKGGVARDGIAIHHLERDAFAHHLKKATAAGKNVLSIIVYKGRVMVLFADGAYYEDTSKYVSQATLLSSAADWGNTGDKTWDLIQIAHKPLTTGTSVEVDYSAALPEGATWSDGVVSSIVGADAAEGLLSSVKSSVFSVKLISNAKTDQSACPTILSFTVRSNPTWSGSPEFNLARFVRLASTDRKDPQAPEVWCVPRDDREWLQDLANGWVTLYEPDGTWRARVTSVADIEPEQPLYINIQGDKPPEFYVISLQLRGTR